MLFAAVPDEVYAIYGCVGVFYLAVLIISIFFHVTLMKAIQACDFRNHMMAPGLVWLRFVPIIHIAMPFINVVAVGSSLQKEFRDRGLRGSDESFGKSLGLTYYILRYVTFFLINGAQIYIAAARMRDVSVCVGGLTLILMLVQLILFIIYWVKVAGFTTQLSESSRRSRYDDDDDDRPRRSRYDDDDDRRPRRSRYDDDDDRRPPSAEVANTVVNCPECKEKLGVAAEDLGHDTKCPVCGTVFTASAPDMPPRAPRRDDRDEADDRRGRSRERDEDDRRPPARTDARTVVTCPECSGKVEVAEADLGHEMWCPLCDKVFTATRDDDTGRPPERA